MWKYIPTSPSIFYIAYLSYVLLKENKFYPSCDDMDFLNILDGGRLIYLSFNITETKHATKNFQQFLTISLSKNIFCRSL